MITVRPRPDVLVVGGIAGAAVADACHRAGLAVQAIDGAPFPFAGALSKAAGSGRPTVPAWLTAPCRWDGLRGLATGAVACVDL